MSCLYSSNKKTFTDKTLSDAIEKGGNLGFSGSLEAAFTDFFHCLNINPFPSVFYLHMI